MNQSSAQTSDLNRRSKELDAREAYLATREKLAEDTEAHIVQLQREEKLLNNTIAERESYLKAQAKRLRDMERDYGKKQAVLEGKLERKQERFLEASEKLDSLKAELTATKAAISERESYQQQQEALIAQQAEDGNLQLRGLEYEIIEAKQVIKDLEIKKNNLYQECKQQESDIETARASFQPEIEEHEAEVSHIQQRKAAMEVGVQEVISRVNGLDKEVNALLIKRQQINADTDAKLQQLDAKEREIMAKREALRQEREEMDEEKHYYRSPKSLYE